MRQKRYVATVIAALILAQVQLLFLSDLHNHKIVLAGFSSAPSTVQSRSRTPGKAESCRICLACMIVRQNAVRPATGAPTPCPFVSAYLRMPPLTARTSSFQPAINFGRAPPASESLA